MAQQPHTVFVSHAHADNALCDRYVDALKQRGLDVWYDRDNLQGGQRLDTEIERELQLRTALVVLLTPASVASYWVRMEVSAFRDLAAHDAGRLLLPVRIADCPVPLLMAGIKWIDAVTDGFDAAMEALISALHVPGQAAASDVPMPAAPTHAHSSTNPHPASTVLDETSPASNLFALARSFVKENLKPVTLDAAQWFDPSGRALVMIGLTLADHGAHAAALAAFDRAIANNPYNVDAWVGKSTVLLDLGREKEAKAALQRAKKLGWKE